MSEASSLRMEHPRFGRLEIPDGDVLHFDGLPGFPAARRFALLAHDRHGVLAWLVSLDDPALAFVVTDPWQFFPDYDPALSDAALSSLGARARDDVELLAMVSLREGRPSLNLLAPLLLCAPTRRGAQCILDDARWSTIQPLPALLATGKQDAPAAQAQAQAPASPQSAPIPQRESKPHR